MNGLLQDVRIGARSLARSRTYALIALLCLALGIGANTTIYSVANTLLYRPLPIGEPDRVAMVYVSYAGGQSYGPASYPDFRDLRDQTGEVFTGLVGQAFAPIGLEGESRGRVVIGMMVSGDHFGLMGVVPQRGRNLLPEDDLAPGSEAVAVLSDHVWRDVFGASEDIIGGTVRLNGHTFTVVGVAPPDYSGTSALILPDVWVPLSMARQVFTYNLDFENRYDPWVFLYGRLRDGVSMDQADAALAAVGTALEEEYPLGYTRRTFGVMPADRARLLAGSTTDSASRMMTILLGVVGFVLLIACLNVANLQLARALPRRQEVAVRYAMGASRWRILRQLLVESLMLALLAGGLGILLALWGVDLLAGIQMEPEFPVRTSFAIDGRVLIFTGLIALTAGIVFGLIPALQTTRHDQIAILREQGRDLFLRTGRVRVQNLLVMGQVAVSLLLLVGAGMFLRSLDNLMQVDPGFDLRQGLVVPVNLGYGDYEEEQVAPFFHELEQGVAALPGVRATALTAFLPLGPVHGHHAVRVDGYEPSPDESLLVKRNLIGPGYCATLGVGLLAGREFTEADRADTEPVAIVNESLARRFFPGGDAVGRTLVADGGVRRTVVGIVRDGRYSSLDETLQAYLCIPLSQAVDIIPRLNLVVATTGPPQNLVEPVYQEVHRLDPGLPLPSIQTIPDYLRRTTGQVLGPALLTGTFGLLALALAMTGVFGVVLFSVNQRSRELAIRMAMGAGNRDVVRMVLGQGLRTSLFGIGFGLLLAFMVARMLTGFLFGVRSLEPVVFLGVTLLVFGVAVLACWLPARRAARVEPMAVLRVE